MAEDATEGKGGGPEELGAISAELDETANLATNPNVEGPLDRLEAAANEIARAWSGSSLGFHANVYYADLKPPPADAHFSGEWGFRGTFQGTTGDWQVVDPEEVKSAIKDAAGNPDLTDAEKFSAEARNRFEGRQADVLSLLSLVGGDDDEFLTKLKGDAESIIALTETQALYAQLPRGGTLMSRDTEALFEGPKSAPHQEILASVIALRSPFRACRELAQVAGRAAGHLGRRTLTATGDAQTVTGDRVFIGHGRSLLWRELKDFIQDRLGLPWDEFNREPVGGVTNQARLAEMMDNAGMALVVMTAEDEQADGSVLARQNVVHEAGLFQGRLGFTRAIVLLEDGCEEFSNIHGLGQIRFPAGRIAATFEDVRRVLEREGLIEP